MVLHTKTLHKSQVPAYFHVPYVESGYRFSQQPWTFYIYSVFYNNMETLNVWTHVVGSLLMTSRLYQIHVIFGLLDPHTWPLLAGTLSFLATYLASSVAHMFSHKSKEVNCCMFMIDFACIGLYGFGTILSHYHYSVFLHVLNTSSFWQILHVGTFLSVLCCTCGAVSKVVVNEPHSKHRGLLTVIGVGLLFLLSIVPIANRMLNSETTAGIHHHGNQMFHMVATGFFFTTRIPERLFPGTFDFLGNSHQVFHLLMIQASESHVNGVVWDMLFRQTFRLPRVKPSFWSTFGPILTISLIDVLVICLFYIAFKKKITKHRNILCLNNNTSKQN